MLKNGTKIFFVLGWKNKIFFHQATLTFYFNSMYIMDKTVDDILREHITIYDELNENKTKYIKQIDYLAFYVDTEAYKLHNPFSEYMYAQRDNNNVIHTKRDNVYAMVDDDKIFLMYAETWKAIKILRRACYDNKRRIDVYGKALRLYYNWYIQWLREYIKTYQRETQRVDIARDTKTKYNEYICDLWYTKDLNKKWKKVIVETDEERTYRTYGNKNSRLFCRIYDKTLDLKDDKFIHAWLYPERYKKECRRFEAKLTLEYARSMTPLEWLDMIPCLKKVEPRKNYDRSTYKTTLLWCIALIDYCIPNYQDQIFILRKAQERITNKIRDINKFTFIDKQDERLQPRNTDTEPLSSWETEC